ncbi:MAG: fatty acid--CoA ligase [Alphaproteobacteria bacterium]
MPYFDEIVHLSDIARVHGKRCPNKKAFIFEDRVTSYKEFDIYSEKVANGLVSENVAEQERVAYMDKNSERFYELVMGCAKSNSVIVGINWRLAPPEVAYILNDSKAKILFVGEDFFGLVDKILKDVPSIEKVICMSGNHNDWPSYQKWRDDQEETICKRNAELKDVAIQMYTSGTTGNPKGVQLTHDNFYSSRNPEPQEGLEWSEWTEDEIQLVTAPTFHIGGAGSGIGGLYACATNVVLKEFEPTAVLDSINDYGITKIFMVPAMMKMILDHPQSRKTNYSTIKYISYGASPIPLDLLKEAIEIFQCGFIQLYGMTETTGSVTYLPPEDHSIEGNERMKSAGKALPHCEIRIVDENSNEVPRREVGEIIVKTTSNMLGYWNLPEETTKTLKSGWLHTGDAGYMDEDGYVYVHDRVKDMIVSGGENIYPAEVESAIFGHENVSDVAVIGVPDEKWGESVKALVVLKDNCEANEEDIINFTRERIAGFKTPKSVDFIKELPRNPSGKILKKELRKPYWEGFERSVN